MRGDFYIVYKGRENNSAHPDSRNVNITDELGYIKGADTLPLRVMVGHNHPGHNNEKTGNCPYSPGSQPQENMQFFIM